MPAKFACANLATTFSAVVLLKTGAVIYLLWSILFSTAVRAVVVSKLVILGILFLTLFILAFRAAVVTKLVILGILFLTSFFTTSLSLFKSTGTGTGLSISSLSTLDYKKIQVLRRNQVYFSFSNVWTETTVIVKTRC